MQQLHKEEEVYKPEMNRIPSRQGKKAVRREDPYAKHDPFANDNNDPFLTKVNDDPFASDSKIRDDPFASGSKPKADPFASDIGGGLSGNNRRSIENLNVKKSKVNDPFADDLDLDNIPSISNKVSKPAVNDPFAANSRQVKSKDPFAETPDPFGDTRQVKSKDPFAATPDPFGESIDPFSAKPKNDPFSNKVKDPFADTDTESNDPFATNRGNKKPDPFGAKKNDPFANDPFATTNDPFGDDPFI